MVGVGAAEAGYIAAQEDRTPLETIGDQRITAAVKTTLLADRYVRGFDINVDTYKTVVTLRGYVRTEKEAERAEDLAASVSGVSEVRSKIVVDAEP